MLLDIRPEKCFLDFCLESKKKYIENGWPNPRLETWRLTQLPKLINQEFSFQCVDRIDFNTNNNSLKPEALNLNSINYFRSKYFCNHLMTEVSLSNFSSGFNLNIPENIKFNNEIKLSSFVKENQWSSPVIVINVGENSEVKISLDIEMTSNSMSTPMISLNIMKGANVSFGVNIFNNNKKVNIESSNIASIESNLFDESKLNMAIAQQGINVSRTDVNVCLNGERSEFYLDGIYFGRDNQHNDITTCVNHLSEGTISRQIIRGILDDKSTGVYQGGIKVSKIAQKTDGQQMSRALLLSELAESNSKPELEIFADDVSCSHGATIGELNLDQFFYLLSRGINKTRAREILIIAYLHELIDSVNNEDLAMMLNNSVDYWLNQNNLNIAA